MANSLQRLTLCIPSANSLAKSISVITVYSRKCSSKSKCNCDCPQTAACKRDSRDTEEECEYYKKLMTTQHVENSCRHNESTCNKHETICDPMDCELKKIEEKSPIPEEIFQQDPPCIPFEKHAFRNECEKAELRKCYAENTRKSHLCTSNKPICFSWDKTYPMRHAGIKPEIDGRPIIGESWKRKSWGIKC